MSFVAAAKSLTVKSLTTKNSSTVPTVTTLAQVTGKRGTLKRRRQIQQLIDYHHQQLDTDLFSSTPYRSSKPITVCVTLCLALLFYALLRKVAFIAMYCHLRPPDAIAFPN